MMPQKIQITYGNLQFALLTLAIPINDREQSEPTLWSLAAPSRESGCTKGTSASTLPPLCRRCMGHGVCHSSNPRTTASCTLGLGTVLDTDLNPTWRLKQEDFSEL